MKKILSTALITSVFFVSCGDGAGDRQVDMETPGHEQPTQDPNANTSTLDTSAQTSQDTSTVVDYDTSAKRR